MVDLVHDHACETTDGVDAPLEIEWGNIHFIQERLADMNVLAILPPLAVHRICSLVPRTNSGAVNDKIDGVVVESFANHSARTVAEGVPVEAGFVAASPIGIPVAS